MSWDHGCGRWLYTRMQMACSSTWCLGQCTSKAGWGHPALCKIGHARPVPSLKAVLHGEPTKVKDPRLLWSVPSLAVPEAGGSPPRALGADADLPPIQEALDVRANPPTSLDGRTHLCPGAGTQARASEPGALHVRGLSRCTQASSIRSAL